MAPRTSVSKDFSKKNLFLTLEYLPTSSSKLEIAKEKTKVLSLHFVNEYPQFANAQTPHH